MAKVACELAKGPKEGRLVKYSQGIPVFNGTHGTIISIIHVLQEVPEKIRLTKFVT